MSLQPTLRRFEPVFVGAALTAPAWIWIALDNSVWPWDPAWYGEVSVDLWATLRLSTDTWPLAMEHAFAIKAPGVAWLGQFFVPFGHLFGSIRIALLASVVLSAAATLALVYLATLRLCANDRRAALVAALCVGGAPLFVSVGHEYFAEPLQALAVAWVLFAAASAHSWPPALTVANLTGAVALGLLAKVSTPAYVAAPAAAALLLSASFARRSGTGVGWRDLRFAASAIPAIFLALSAIFWYHTNLRAALDHAELAAADTGLYGTQHGFTSELAEWLSRLEDAAFLPYFSLVAVFLVAAWAFRAMRSRVRPSWQLLVVVASCLVTIAGLLIVFARQANEDPRFVLALVLPIALILGAVVHATQSRLLALLVVAVFAAQYALATAASFGVATKTFSYYRLVEPQRRSFESTLHNIVQTTCPPNADGRISVVGAEYPWLNGNTLSLIASEEFALAGRQCEYTPLGYAEKSVDAAWNRVLAIAPPFYVALDYGNAANRLPPELEAAAIRPDPFNQVNRGVYWRAVRSRRFVAVPGTRRSGLVVLRAAAAD